MAHEPESSDGSDLLSDGNASRKRLEKKKSGKDARRIARAERALARSEAPRSSTGPRRGIGRNIATFAAVAGLVATVAIPAYAAWQPEDQSVTLQQVAEDGAQSLVIASSVQESGLQRGTYSATSAEEIAIRKAEEEAIARAKAAEEARASAASSSSSESYALPAGAPVVAAGSGAVRRPLPYFNNFGEPYAGHRGVDYMVEGGTPIYAVADGVVTASSESGPGWGVYVEISHNLGGNNVRTLYAHMTYGSRTVGVGDYVSAGQMIGQVGDSGAAWGTHLHLEVILNGTYLNGEDWLLSNGA